NGALQQVTKLKLTFKEATSPAEVVNTGRSAAKNTAGTNSPLASGTWHKISVPHTGLYKIDYNYLAAKMGVKDIPSAQIRVFGHGGKMLPEANRPEGVNGLTESAIWVNDGGDGSFDPGDFFVFYAQGPLNWKPDNNKSMLLQDQN